MKQISLLIVSLIVLVSSDHLGEDLCGCGDWAAYKDEKCYQVVDKSAVGQSDAAVMCKQLDEEAILATIKTKEEQTFVENYLKKSNIVDYVWIGLKRNGIDGQWKWSDNTDLEYANWADGNPITRESLKKSRTNADLKSNDYDCVQITTDPKVGYGQWRNIQCEKRNVFVCQKMQNWSTAQMQSILIDARRNYLDTIAKHQAEIAEVKKALPVPIGFVYVQLAGQSEPKDIWKGMEWTQITENYTGLFFRAEGGASAPFGDTQEQLTRTYELQSGHIGHASTNPNYTHGPIPVGPDFYPYWLFTGDNTGADYYGIKMKHNNQEIRPRNQAIRIWKRTG